MVTFIQGSFRYWVQKRYEIIAKIEQLGPFNLFFTLSCADKRWPENFTSILQQQGKAIKYIYNEDTDTTDIYVGEIPGLEALDGLSVDGKSATKPAAIFGMDLIRSKRRMLYRSDEVYFSDK